MNKATGRESWGSTPGQRSLSSLARRSEAAWSRLVSRMLTCRHPARC